MTDAHGLGEGGQGSEEPSWMHHERETSLMPPPATTRVRYSLFFNSVRTRSFLNASPRGSKDAFFTAKRNSLVEQAGFY